MIKKFAFTLAEVLITLGIIGIIAELTIPALIDSADKAEYVAGLRKTYSVLSQAQLQVAGDAGGSFQDSLSGLDADSSTSNDVFANLFAQKMNVVKTCPSTDTTNTCFVDSYRTLDNYVTPGWTGLSSFIAKDGTAYSFILRSPDCAADPTSTYPIDRSICGEVLIDVNGPNRGPAKVGRDIFALWVNKNGVYPSEEGHPQDEIDEWCSKGTHPLSSGWTCATKVLNEGAMNY